MNIRFTPFVLLVLFASSCTQDKMPTLIELDMELRNLVSEASPTKDLNYYILPTGSDLSVYPQDEVFNPLTPEKVELGKLLYFETGLAQDALKPEGMGTYSCSTCHIAEAGFKSGNFQGVADGGIGFGINGTSRLRNLEYEEEEMDVQAARVLTMVNVGFVENTSWNGSFGATGVNVGTEEVWAESENTARNSMGMQGLETQNIDGILVHRLSYTPEVIDSLGYKDLFDLAFSDVDESERYTPLTGSLALSCLLYTSPSPRDS